MLGSDSVGRDVLLRTIAGGRESVALGLGVIAIVVVLGMTAGLIGGYFGGMCDYVVNKVVTAFQAFPSFVLAVAIAGILGQGTVNMMVAIAAVYWTQFARLSRSIVMTFKESDCLRAAKMCGAPTRSIIARYLIPKIAGPIAIMAALSISDVILTMAGLSFIGLGPERPTNEWGTMMAEAQPTFQYALWCMIVPMIALFITVILFNLLGDALRDALDSASQHHSEAAAEPCGLRRLPELLRKGEGGEEAPRNMRRTLVIHAAPTRMNHLNDRNEKKGSDNDANKTVSQGEGIRRGAYRASSGRIARGVRKQPGAGSGTVGQDAARRVDYVFLR